MRVGSLVYCTWQGLGILAKDFVANGVITDPYVVEHRHHPNNFDWFPNAPRTNIRPLDIQSVREWLKSIDVLLALETPFEWSLIDYCREIGVKTAILVMHECMPEMIAAQPDLWLCPSGLDTQWACRHSDEGRTGVNMMIVPVGVQWRQRHIAEVFVHNAGHGGLKGRNGTKELLEAWKYVKSPAKLLLRSQKVLEVDIDDKRITERYGTVSHDLLFSEGDVFTFPEKFNGLSLPLQEARAAGMLVMCGDRFPMNTWLPKEPLIPVTRYHKERIGPAYNEYDCAEFDPKTIAAKVDEWYGRDIAQYSLEGRVWAEANSWAALKPQYLEVLESL